MTWLNSLFERRTGSSLATPERWLVDWVNGGTRSATGISVTDENALACTAVCAAVTLLAETIATLPLHIYKRLPNGGKERDATHPLYTLLHDQPNRWQTSVEFWEMLIGHFLLRGNGYAKVVGTGGQAVSELVPIHPDRVRVRQPFANTIVYEYTPFNAPPELLFPGELLHLRGFSLDGLTGLSQLALHREAIGVSLAAEEYAARLFGNSAKPSGVLQMPAGKSFADAERKKQFRSQWNQTYGGLENAHKVAVLEDGMTWQQIGINPDDAQFLESRKFQVTEIARAFRVPPHMIGDLDRSTNNNIEQQSLELVIYSLRPRLVRIEKAIRRDIFGETDSRTHFAEFLVDGLLRGDIKTRTEALAVQRQNGVINADEWRELENRNPLENDEGKKYLIPLNMIGAGETPPAPAAPAAPAQKRQNEDAMEIARRCYEGLLGEAWARILTREAHLARDAKRSLGGPGIIAALQGQGEYARRALEPVLLAAGATIQAIAGTYRVMESEVRALAGSMADAYQGEATAAWATVAAAGQVTAEQIEVRAQTLGDAAAIDRATTTMQRLMEHVRGPALPAAA